ncbi:hypothetical protein LJB99_03240 [Deltaproteobacteria bacterium OttesenSCG-928-K17]|nr:hypothetical protein [Deltaproteobacteria bacterium OttesenSCG-928-K17]
MDISTGAYRTGLNDKPVEQGFSWDFKDGLRTLYNRQGEKILTIDPQVKQRRSKTQTVKSSGPRKAPNPEIYLKPLAAGLRHLASGKHGLRQLARLLPSPA